MALNTQKLPELVPDVLQVVFQHLVGDNETLLNISLTCRAWHSLALPFVYQAVDVSIHNIGRMPERESEVVPIFYSDYDIHWEHGLIPRQQSFIHLMTNKPQLSKYVKTFTWTILWVADCDIDEITEIDRQTWDVFDKLVNVNSLDLASLSRARQDDYVRENPARLFPKVRDLRLLGWMHRGLVRAIFASLEPRNLRSLKLDYLDDEGALPNGEPMSEAFATRNAHHAKSTAIHGWPNLEAAKSSDVISEDLIMRQENGQAYIFPGPMWLPLHLLSACALDSLTHLQLKVPPFSMTTDLRNYHTLFQRTASFIIKVRETLETLVIVFGEHKRLYDGVGGARCRPNRLSSFECYRPWCIQMAKLFLEQQISALNENAFPRLETIRFEGFHLLEAASSWGVENAELAGVFQSIQDCRFSNATFTEISSVEYRDSFPGHEREPGDDRFLDLLITS